MSSQEEVQFKVEETVAQVQETQRLASRISRLQYMTINEKLPDMAQDTPEQTDEYKLELIKQAFYNGTDKNIGSRIKYTAEEAATIDGLGNSRVPLQIDISSVFAEGQEDPQAWLNDLAACVRQAGHENIASNASLGQVDPSTPAHLINGIISNHLGNEIYEHHDSNSALKDFQESCGDLSKKILEKKLETMSGLYRPNRSQTIWESWTPWSTNTELVGRLSGNVIAESALSKEPFNLGSLQDVNARLQAQLNTKERHYQTTYGEAAPENLDGADNLPERAQVANDTIFSAPHMKSYLEFQPSAEMTEGLTKIYSSEDPDILPALRLRTRITAYKKVPGIGPMMENARLTFFRGVDQVTAVISNNSDMQLFRRAGMVPDDRSVDWDSLTFRLVEEDSLDVPTTVDAIFPRDIKDVTTEEEEDEGEEKEEMVTVDEEGEKSGWLSMTEEDFSYLTR
ncbi:hypothetical protein IAR50_003622 [Cryptococcus sp. DSM 104548]